MWYGWLIDNSWLADWLGVVQIGIAEGTVIYLLVRYLRGFLGGMSPKQLRILQWRLGDLTTLTEADKIRMKEQGIDVK